MDIANSTPMVMALAPIVVGVVACLVLSRDSKIRKIQQRTERIYQSIFKEGSRSR